MNKRAVMLSRWKRFKRKVRVWWYRSWHGISVNINGSMLPSLGTGKFVSVKRKGDYIDIIQHKSSIVDVPVGTIRLIPVDFNHGLMVEWWDKDEKLHGRTHLSYGHLYMHVRSITEITGKNDR